VNQNEEKLRDMEEKCNNSPTHHKTLEIFKFGLAQGLSENVSPVEIAIHFKDLKGTNPGVILKMMELQGNMLGTRFKSYFYSCKNYEVVLSS
jgi:hypothetical protein